MAKLLNSGHATNLLTIRDWSVMFIDLVGSTELKYRTGNDIAAQIIKVLFKIIEEHTEGAKKIKFTGDGAMVIFKKEEDGALNALEAAERILQKVDDLNLRFEYPRIHIRTGIATGECYEVSGVGDTELSGKTADLAARLQGEAEVDTILVDEATKESSRQPPHRFTKCDRRLSLKGVPPPAEGKPESFYYFKADRFLKPPKQEHYSKGLLALYPDRTSLLRDLPAIRLIRLAKQGSTILVAGRTLKHWKKLGAEMRRASDPMGKNLQFHLVISSQSLVDSDRIRQYLDEEQIAEMKRDLPEARDYFLDLVEEEKGNEVKHFQLRETDYLILDGITCAEVLLPGNEAGDGKLVTLQDINAAPGENKATFLLACRCNEETKEDSCMAHGLHERTNLIFNQAKALTRGEQSKPIERILRQHHESNRARNNSPTEYVSSIKKYFPLIDEGKLDQIPPPICIQVQVSSTCSTHCQMCDHWKTPQKGELEFDDWQKVFEDIAGFGVKSVIFSGGEPLMRPDIAALLKSANEKGLNIGLLTNGTMLDEDIKYRQRVIGAIKEHVKWVAISIDGTPSEDEDIRNPEIEERVGRLKEFCAGLKGEDGPNLSATVTLQKKNVDMNIKKVIEFITNDLGIPKVNFKLATGAGKALAGQLDFLLSEEKLEGLDTFLWNNALTQDNNNNLDYLRRCFANGVFNVGDAADGAPIRSLYVSDDLRCHTPFLFSLIDSDGTVYPCCHLYRDNHGSNSRSQDFRQKHSMGNVKEIGFHFSSIWNGEKYKVERESLKKINPNDADFLPCGECTRHCQHNRVLTQIYREYEKDYKTLDELPDNNTENKPVWF